MPRLKSWESPRRKGRNDKGKGGSARARQIRKQMQMLRQKLKDNSAKPDINNRGDLIPSFFFDGFEPPFDFAQGFPYRLLSRLKQSPTGRHDWAV
jgi:hypothetical protein